MVGYYFFGRWCEALDKDGDHKKMAQDPMEEYVLGQYPYNVKRTCILHDYSEDKDSLRT